MMSQNVTSNGRAPTDRSLSRWARVGLFLAACVCCLQSRPATAQLRSPVTVNCPSNMTVECEGPAGAVVTFQITAVSTAGRIASLSAVPASKAMFPLGLTTVYCTATDTAGNKGSSTFQVTVLDRVGPSITVPSPITVSCAPPGGQRVDFSLSATDLHDGPVTVKSTPVSGSLFPPGVTTVTCTAADAARNQTVKTFTVTVLPDTNAPVLNLPASLNLPCTGPSGTVVTFQATATDDCSRSVPVTCAPPSGSLFPMGTTTVSCSATDAASNVVRGSFVIKVSTNCAADCITLSCPTNQVIDASGPEGAVAQFKPTATTHCSTAPTVLTCNPPSGTVFGLGTNTVSCQATDDHGNQAQCSFEIVVLDRRPPSLVTPGALILTCSGLDGAVANFNVTATDMSDPNPQVVCTPPSGSLFPIGSNLVTCVATDASGNSISQTFPVVVTADCLLPCLAIECASNIVVEAPPSRLPTVYFAVAGTNSCSGQGLEADCVPPSGSTFSAGSTTVNCQVSAYGLSRSCSFLVTVLDKTPPIIKVPRIPKVPCSGRNIQDTPEARVYYNVTAWDIIDPAPNLTCVPPSGSWFPVGTHPVVCTATDASGNTSQKEFSVTVISGPKCEITASPGSLELTPDNWGFENGLQGWWSEGDAMATQPNEGDLMPAEREPPLRAAMESAIGGDYWRQVNYSVGHQGKFWVSTGHNLYNRPGLPAVGPLEELTGELQSKVFSVSSSYVSFLIGGGNDPDKLRVELLVNLPNPGPGAIKLGPYFFTPVMSATGSGRELMHRKFYATSGYTGRLALFRIVDQSATGHLNVDDFRFHDVSPPQATIQLGNSSFPAFVKNDTEYYDWDSPVWGFADFHTHPMSYLGFGNMLLHGQPDGHIYEALGDCNPTHGGWGLDNGGGDYTREAVVKLTDDKGIDPHREGWHSEPWKQFRKWPVFSTVTHQQMWYQWVRRTYDGGLRVMVALCVNNPLLAAGVKGPGPRDDREVGDQQITELKAFVARHSDFMEIPLDPVQLRDIVRRDKLAVIIGSELDDIGNFVGNPIVQASADDISRQVVKAEIQRLYDRGVRYIFPVHLMNNKFAGTAVGSDMLNIANKYTTGEAFDVKAAAAADHITARLETLDFTDYAALGLGGLALGPLMLPVLEGVAATVSADFGPVPPGLTSMAAGLIPLGLMAFAPPLIAELANDGIPLSIFPFFGNYPTYPDAPYGHRNKVGLTPLGEFAVKEMMRLGMMIDMDHMSQDAVHDLLAIAKSMPEAYPLNSGHNSFREINEENGENNRSPGQLEEFRQLGGVMGVGYENANTSSVEDAILYPHEFSSTVENTSAGTSRSFAQNYLYALEKLGRHGIGLGTDANGLVVGPGPRFGGQGSFGLGEGEFFERYAQIKEQKNGVLYTPQHGIALTTAAFAGKAVDPDREFDKPRSYLGYAYNRDQRDFFAALRIFFWHKDSLPDSPEELNSELETIQDALVGAYDQRRVKEYAFGLLKGIKNWDPGSDVFSGDTGTREQLGKAMCRLKLFNKSVPSEITDDSDKWKRFKHHLVVWDDYQKVFGSNLPLKRCVTLAKEWDINFEGVAHYGLIPDFLQDLSNVGVNSDDLSPLFQSAEDFAQMWANCLRATYSFTPHIIRGSLKPFADSSSGQRYIQISFAHGGEPFDIETTDSLEGRGNWQPASISMTSSNDIQSTITMPMDGTHKFYRLKKRN